MVPVRILGKWSPHSERLNWDASIGIRKEAPHRQVRGPLPSLKSLCARIVAQNARTFTSETLETLNEGLLQEIWQNVVSLGRDSLETWLLFLEAAEKSNFSTFPSRNPVYRCYVSSSELCNVHAQLRGTLCCEYPPTLKECVVTSHGTSLNSRLLRTLSGFRNLQYLDLRLAEWPREIDEAQNFLNILVKNINRGGFQELRCLRFPKRGPGFLKNAMRIIWPRNLKFIQTPVKPKDTNQWHTVPSSELTALSARSISVQYFELSGPRIDHKPEYETGCYQRRRMPLDKEN